MAMVPSCRCSVAVLPSPDRLMVPLSVKAPEAFTGSELFAAAMTDISAVVAVKLSVPAACAGFAGCEAPCSCALPGAAVPPELPHAASTASDPIAPAAAASLTFSMSRPP